MSETEFEDEQECGYVYDHDTETVYEGEDGLQWICRRCGGEGWEDAPTAAGEGERGEG